MDFLLFLTFSFYVRQRATRKKEKTFGALMRKNKCIQPHSRAVHIFSLFSTKYRGNGSNDLCIGNAVFQIFMIVAAELQATILTNPHKAMKNVLTV